MTAAAEQLNEKVLQKQCFSSHVWHFTEQDEAQLANDLNNVEEYKLDGLEKDSQPIRKMFCKASLRENLY